MALSQPDEGREPDDAAEVCAECGRELWINGTPPVMEGNAWICTDCDAANNLDVMLDW